MAAAPMSGLEKAAVLLKSLSPTVVDKVLAYMDPKQAKVLSAEIAKAGARPDLKEAASRVLDEAATVLAEDKSQPAHKPSETAKPTSVDVRVDGTTAIAPADPLAALASIAPELLTKALDSESARTVSLLMNRMDVELAGQIYKRLTSAKRKEVAIRLLDVLPVTDDLLRHMAEAVLKKCQSMSGGVGGVGSVSDQGEREKRMAGLIRSLERTERMETLTALEEADAELAGRIKAMLYLFEDILRMENSAIQKLLSEIDMKALSSALYGAQAEISERILANLSRRAQESLKEEVELSGKVPSAKVKQARTSLEEAMQRLDQRGELVMMES